MGIRPAARRERAGALGHALVMRRLGCSAGFMVVNRAGRLRLGLLAED